ncbi:hypothetical protein H0A36_15105 [Endozoicomonas sp. SM1973]|uniref:Uncharacterized protein n=1 Tax=Spartinivicinus marinus TaxID=2994442 RepID=A0A853IBB4_9GAMM|nr:hypothetical protein [Spartinivicinus marinus]MCX4026241.1 hypothetical protein [Spartinivicinus marinus]NYZ67344.1 hypothetical protein [Spartinivicinus marinus]
MKAVTLLIALAFISPITTADPHDSYREVRDHSLTIDQNSHEQATDLKPKLVEEDCSLKSDGNCEGSEGGDES